MRSILWIVASGVLARLVLLLLFDPGVQVFSGDSQYYAEMAFRMRSGHLPTALRPPGYPAFLAITMFGWALPMLVQSALTIFSGVATYLVFRNRGGFVAGLCIAACPFLAIFDLRLLSESLYGNLVWLAWLALYRKMHVTAGLLLGLSILCRDTLLLLPLFAALFGFFLHQRRTWVMALVAYLLVAPWIAVTGHLSEGRLGQNLWAGTWERNADWYSAGLQHPQFPAYAFRSPQEERFVRSHWNDDKGLQRMAIDHMKSDPLGTVRAWVVRYPRLWIGTRSDEISFRFAKGTAIWYILKLLFVALDLSIIAFGLWGFRFNLFAVPVLYAAAIYIPFHGSETRYTLFALPFLILFGSLRLFGAKLRSRKNGGGDIHSQMLLPVLPRSEPDYDCSQIGGGGCSGRTPPPR